MMTETDYPPMPPVGSPTPPELLRLPKGTKVDVYVDGVVRTGWIDQSEMQYDCAPGEPPIWVPKPGQERTKLIPGYMIGLGGSMAFVKARNIVKVYPKPEPVEIKRDAFLTVDELMARIEKFGLDPYRGLFGVPLEGPFTRPERQMTE